MGNRSHDTGNYGSSGGRRLGGKHPDSSIRVRVKGSGRSGVWSGMVKGDNEDKGGAAGGQRRATDNTKSQVCKEI